MPPARAARALILAAALVAAGTAHAADAGPGLRLPAPPATSGLPDLGLAAPVTVQRVRFEGATAIATAELEALAAPFLNRPLRALDLEDLRQTISRAYVDRGHVNSGAVLGDDALQGGTLTLRIVEGRVTRIRQSGLQRLTDAYLASRLVHGDEVLDVNRLQERFQLQLADPLFSRLNARLLPDDGPGRAVLDVEVTRARPWQVSLFAHNHLAPAVGSVLAGIDGSVRNLLGWGDALTATLGRGEGSTSYDAGWQLPLGGSRTLASLRLARGASSLVEEPVAVLDIGSAVTTREATLAHPLLDQPRRRWLLGVTHALRRNRTTLAGEPFSFVPGESTGVTRIESWRLFQELTLRLDRHVIALRASVVDGRNNLVGETPLPQALPRRYRLWQLQGQAALALGDAGRQIVLRGLLQRSPDRLLPLEQLAVGGRHTVRGYRENQLVRDNGWAVGAEWHWPLWRDEARRASLTLLPFIDAGAGWNAGEDETRLAAAGLGFNWTLADLEGELHVARRLERRHPDTHGDLQDRGIHLLLRWRPSF